ncbi:MAG: hypothetical protein MH321_07425 [Leptospiraceae bacterium]|nr:hypothetical protein [Leptospiraceae bacterium]
MSEQFTFKFQENIGQDVQLTSLICVTQGEFKGNSDSGLMGQLESLTFSLSTTKKQARDLVFLQS